MRAFCISLVTWMLICAFVYDQKDQERSFRELYGLEGKWIMKTRRGAIGEEWKKIDDAYLQSRGFFINGSDTVQTETVALKDSKQGIFYTSTVENQNNRQPVSFKLTSSADHVFIFENKEHDFPKRIVYEFVSADSLHAYIDAGIDVPGKRQDFYYKKVK